MQRSKNAIASPTTPKKRPMTEAERKESNKAHNAALMTLPVQELLDQGYISIMQVPTLLIARKQAAAEAITEAHNRRYREQEQRRIEQENPEQLYEYIGGNWQKVNPQ